MLSDSVGIEGEGYNYVRSLIALVALFSLIGGMAGLSIAQEPSNRPQATYSDPVTYCRAVITSKGPPDNRYTGPADVPWIARAMKFDPGTGAGYVAWGCDKGAVVACLNGGITGPCNDVNVTRTPWTGLIEFCRAEPNAEIPAAVTGHYTIFDWYCFRGRPVIRRQMTIPDHRGYVPGDYVRVTPPVSPQGFETGKEYRQLFRAIGNARVTQLQRGFQVYKEVCAACHGLGNVKFADLAGVGFSARQVGAIAARWPVEIAANDVRTGKSIRRAAMPSDRFPAPYEDDWNSRAANNGRLPPDLAQWIKRTAFGPDKLFSALSSYDDREPLKTGSLDHEAKRQEGLLWINPYLDDGLTGMPPSLFDGQVTYPLGQPKPTVSQMSADVAIFIEWASTKVGMLPQLAIMPVSPLHVQFGYFNEAYARSQGRQHLGLDIPAPVNAEVFTPFDGEVVLNRTNAVEVLQAYLVVRGADGSEQVFGHISSALRVGDRISAGMVVGRIRAWPGEPGRNHLHWGINKQGVIKVISGAWGFGRAPITATQDEANRRGWIDPQTLLADFATAHVDTQKFANFSVSQIVSFKDEPELLELMRQAVPDKAFIADIMDNPGITVGPEVVGDKLLVWTACARLCAFKFSSTVVVAGTGISQSARVCVHDSRRMNGG